MAAVQKNKSNLYPQGQVIQQLGVVACSQRHHKEAFLSLSLPILTLEDKENVRLYSSPSQTQARLLLSFLPGTMDLGGLCMLFPGFTKFQPPPRLMLAPSLFITPKGENTAPVTCIGTNTQDQASFIPRCPGVTKWEANRQELGSGWQSICHLSKTVKTKAPVREMIRNLSQNINQDTCSLPEENQQKQWA